MSKKDAQLIGIRKGKQKASSIEPQEKEIFKNTRSCPTQAVWVLLSQEESWLRTIVLKQNWEMDQVSWFGNFVILPQA